MHGFLFSGVVEIMFFSENEDHIKIFCWKNIWRNTLPFGVQDPVLVFLGA